MCVAFTGLMANAATAQSKSSGPNWRAQPMYGTVSLSSGFSPDPYTRSVEAGGSSSNPISGSGCTGYINMDAPDVDLNYQSGSYPLAIEAGAEADVSLLVFTPDGEWLCDDDGGDGTDARIQFSNPQSGNYNIWVGTYSSSVGTPDATLSFSERTSSSSSTSSTSSPSELNWQATPTSGTVTLNKGFLPDPHVTTVLAGGSTRNPVSGSGCTGYVAANAPDLDLNYTAGSSGLYISTRSSVDVTLIIYTPDGEWLCDDDDGDGQNAMIGFSSPQSGNYNIWVGTYDESDKYTRSELHISERRP